MRETRTSGLMSGDGKRSDADAAQATAPVLELYWQTCERLAISLLLSWDVARIHEPVVRAAPAEEVKG